MATALGRLSDEGWSLDAEAAAELLNTECGSAQPPLQQALAALLDADLKQVGAPSLPDDINRADSKKVAGPLVLQVSAVSDISQPSRASGDSERKGRILRLKLTDGRISCVGIEFAPLPYSLGQLCPGTKVRLCNVTVRLGVLLLEPKAIEVLGGRVEALAEGWEVQQKYGGTATERVADAADADRPPPFRHFDPKMAKYGSRRGALAAKSAQTAPAGSSAAAGAAAQQQQQAASSQQAGLQRAAPQQQQRQGRRGFQPYQPPPSRQGAGDAAAAAEQAQPQQQRGGRRGEQPVQQQRQPRGQGHAATAAQPPPPPQLAAHASAAPAPTAAEKPSAAAAAPSAAAQKLLGRLQVEEGRYGRGQRRGRRGRFRDEEEDDGALTLEEWEAQQAARRTGAAAGGTAAAVLNGGGSSGAASTQQQQQQQQQLSDEELARQLQRQLDLEAAAEWGRPLGQQPEQDLAATLFTFDRPDSGDSSGRGRGRGRGRGGRGRGRGSGRGRH